MSNKLTVEFSDQTIQSFFELLRGPTTIERISEDSADRALSLLELLTLNKIKSEEKQSKKNNELVNLKNRLENIEDREMRGFRGRRNNYDPSKDREMRGFQGRRNNYDPSKKKRKIFKPEYKRLNVPIDVNRCPVMHFDNSPKRSPSPIFGSRPLPKFEDKQKRPSTPFFGKPQTTGANNDMLDVEVVSDSFLNINKILCNNLPLFISIFNGDHSKIPDFIEIVMDAAGLGGNLVYKAILIKFLEMMVLEIKKISSGGAAPSEPRPTAPSEPRPTAPSEPRPTAPSEPRPTAPGEPRPTAPGEPGPLFSKYLYDNLLNEMQVVSLKDEQVVPKDEQVVPKDEQVVPKDEQVAPKDEQVAPKDEQVAPKDEQVAPKDEQVAAPIHVDLFSNSEDWLKSCNAMLNLIPDENLRDNLKTLSKQNEIDPSKIDEKVIKNILEQSGIQLGPFENLLGNIMNNVNFQNVENEGVAKQAANDTTTPSEDFLKNLIKPTGSLATIGNYDSEEEYGPPVE
jgi:hypothetical protein